MIWHFCDWKDIASSQYYSIAVISKLSYQPLWIWCISWLCGVCSA